MSSVAPVSTVPAAVAKSPFVAQALCRGRAPAEGRSLVPGVPARRGSRPLRRARAAHHPRRRLALHERRRPRPHRVRPARDDGFVAGDRSATSRRSVFRTARPSSCSSTASSPPACRAGAQLAGLSVESLREVLDRRRCPARAAPGSAPPTAERLRRPQHRPLRGRCSRRDPAGNPRRRPRAPALRLERTGRAGGFASPGAGGGRRGERSHARRELRRPARRFRPHLRRHRGARGRERVAPPLQAAGRGAHGVPRLVVRGAA